MNNLTVEQNEPQSLRLLRARSRVYQEAKIYQVAQLLIVVLLPMVAAVNGLASAASRPYVAALSLLATFMDVLWLDRVQRNRAKTGARIGEMFDCKLLDLPWNKFVAGDPVDALSIAELERAWTMGDKNLIDWYKPNELATAPLHVARVICQKTNLWYDGHLRRRVGTALVVGTIAIGLALCIAGVVLHLPFPDFVLTVVAPFAPLMTWASREYYRQRDTADVLDTIKSSADELWGQVVNGECQPDYCAGRSREFQDAIFNRRANSPPHVPLAYRLLRPRMEPIMEAGAAAMLAEYDEATSG
jgi:hypothetical protein